MLASDDHQTQQRELFKPRMLSPIFLLAFGLCNLGLVVAACWKLLTHDFAQDSQALTKLVFNSVQIVPVAIFLVYLAGSEAARLRVDDRRITRLAWWGRTSIEWDDLAGIEESGWGTSKCGIAEPRRLLLLGAGGERVKIAFSRFQSPGDLRRRLETRVAPVRARMQLELAKLGAEYRPARGSGRFILALLAPACLLAGVMIPLFYGSAPFVPTRESLLVGGLCAVMGVLFAIMGIELMSQILSVSIDRLEARSLFQDCTIPFHAIESIHLSLGKGDRSSMVTARISSNEGKTILISSLKPYYRPILELVLERARPRITGLPLEDPDLA